MEDISAAAACDKTVWLKRLLADLKIDEPTPISVFEDHQCCIRLSLSEKTGGHTKHVHVKHHIIREMHTEGLLQLEYCPFKDMTTNILTKPLARDRCQHLPRK